MCARTTGQLFLHVGMPKTGTTNLQNRLMRNREQGWVDFLERLPDELIERDLALRIHLLSRIFTERDRDVADALLGHLRNWLSEKSATPMMLCSELLSQTPLFSGERVAEVFAHLAEVTEIRIVVVIRPYFSWLESFINQAAKTGHAEFSGIERSPEKFFGAWELNYGRLVGFYEACLPRGRNHVSVLPFSPSVNEEVARLAKLELPASNRRADNSSLSAYNALQAFARLKNLDLSLMPQDQSLRFVGRRQIAAWRPQVADWAHPLADRLEWPRELIDDGDQAFEAASEVSYLDIMTKVSAPRLGAVGVTPKTGAEHGSTGVAAPLGVSAARKWESRGIFDMTENTQTTELTDEERKVVYAVSRIFARTALAERGTEAPAGDEVTAEWQSDKVAYQRKGQRFVRALESAGYAVTSKKG